MDDQDPARFEDTLDVLSSSREEIEERFRDLLAELAEHVDAVRAATERSAEIYQRCLEARRKALADVKEGLRGASAAPQVEPGWPTGRGFVRRRLNRVLRWLLRDYLERVDHRFDARSARIDRLKVSVDRLHDTVALGGEEAEALHTTLGHARDALQSALASHAEIVNLVNAKDAELLQRAVAGPLRRMEVLFDEFSRQQEGLLSQLVGRRRELEELVAAVAPVRKEESR